MSKSKLKRFIEKYTLGGEIKSVKWSSDGKSLSTRFISGDKSVVGSVVLDKFSDIEPSDLGIYNTPQFSALLGIMGDDVEFKLTSSGDKFISIDMKDTKFKTTAKYMLSDLSVIPTPPELRNLPSEFDLDIKVDSNFINTFIAGKGALSDTDNFTVITDGTDTKLVIGHSSVNTNRVTIPVTTSKCEDIDNVSFNANVFKEVLSANKECESAKLEVSGDGLSRITFKIDDYESTYYLVSVQDVD